MKKVLLLGALIAFAFLRASGQEEQKVKYIQIDGLTVDEHGSLVHGVSIWSKQLHRGAASDSRGIFSIISIPGDTVFFSAIGFKSTLLTIPANLAGTNYITDVKMITDTILIGEVMILPWKTYSEFKRAVLENKPEDPMLKNMQYNLALVEQQIWSDMRSTPGQGYRYNMQQMSDNLYTKGQGPVNNLLNPVSWTRFIRDVKGGLLRNEKSTSTKRSKIKVRKKKSGD